MVYFDNSGPRIRRSLRRRSPQDDSELDPAKTRYILNVAEEYPRFTPEEVYAEIYYGRRRHDIPKEMVRRVLVNRRRNLLPRLFGR
ncbi:hypothetical protein AB0N81_10665 [Streptomyces sp. NPDC093510]|uniref:hypothetical protein n=1 Tax=Streptomyces sp. NPDC093510 TaxID=3155199 RepID=UPI0034312DD6